MSVDQMLDDNVRIGMPPYFQSDGELIVGGSSGPRAYPGAAVEFIMTPTVVPESGPPPAKAPPVNRVANATAGVERPQTLLRGGAHCKHDQLTHGD